MLGNLNYYHARGNLWEKIQVLQTPTLIIFLLQTPSYLKGVVKISKHIQPKFKENHPEKGIFWFKEKEENPYL